MLFRSTRWNVAPLNLWRLCSVKEAGMSRFFGGAPGE